MQLLSLASKHLINVRMIMRIMGWLLLIEAAFLLVPTFTAVAYGESDWIPFLSTAALTALVGFIMARRSRPTRSHLGKRDGYLLTAMVWVVFSFFGLIPFLFCSRPVSYSDAFFEAMSGFTTTGATVLDSVEGLGHGVHLWRAMMQWIGGMGIILFTIAVIPMLNHSGGMQMFNAEVTGITHDKLRPRISQTAKGLWLTYIVLTVLLFGLLILGPMNPFEAICHAFSTMSTGGFSTSDDGIAAWSSVYIESVITVFMFLGGTSFVLLYHMAHGEFKLIWQNEVFRTYVGIIFFCYILFVIAIFSSGEAYSIKSLTLDPLFQIVSTITSTGYVTPDLLDWGTFVLALVFILMFFGACAGSTSGGAKIDRMIYLLKHCRNEIDRCIYPNYIFTVRVNKRVIPHEIVAKVIAFLCLYVLIIMVGGILLCALGLPLVDSFFSAFSCVSNTGLGAGITGYGGNYEIVPDIGKWVLALIMMIGRLELFTVLILFTPTFWKK